MSMLQRLNQVVVTLEKLAHGVGMCAVIAVMLTVTTDTFMRYVLNSPLQWAYDVISLYFMVIIACLPVSATFTRGQHVNVTLFYHAIPAKAKIVVNAAAAFLIFGLGALIAYASIIKSWHAYMMGDVQLGYTAFAMWLSHLPIAIGFSVFTIRMALTTALWTFAGNDPFVVRDGEVVE